MDGERYHDGLSGSVEWVWVERRRKLGNVDADSAEHCADNEWARSQSCLDVQEKEGTREDENADDDRRSSFQVLSGEDFRHSNVPGPVGPCNVGKAKP